jgi:hypothetical protein
MIRLIMILLSCLTIFILSPGLLPNSVRSMVGTVRPQTIREL